MTHIWISAGHWSACARPATAGYDMASQGGKGQLTPAIASVLPVINDVCVCVCVRDVIGSDFLK